MFGSFAAAAGVFWGLGAIVVWNMSDSKEVRGFDKKFEQIQIGHPESKVLAILGEPNAKKTDFRIGQEKGYEDAYIRAEASDCAYYLIWEKGIDVVFTIGINNKSLVCVKESGGT